MEPRLGQGWYSNLIEIAKKKETERILEEAQKQSIVTPKTKTFTFLNVPIQQPDIPVESQVRRAATVQETFFDPIAVETERILKTNPPQIVNYLNSKNVSPEVMAQIRDRLAAFAAGRPKGDVYTDLFSGIDQIEPIIKFTYTYFPDMYETAMAVWLQTNPEKFFKDHANYLFSIQNDAESYNNSKNHLRLLVEKYLPNWLDVASFDSLMNFGGQVFPDLTPQIWQRQIQQDLDRFLKINAEVVLQQPESQREIGPFRDWITKNLPKGFLQNVSQDTANKVIQAFMPEALADMANEVAVETASTGGAGIGKIGGVVIIGLIALVGISALMKPKAKRNGKRS